MAIMVASQKAIIEMSFTPKVKLNLVKFSLVLKFKKSPKEFFIHRKKELKTLMGDLN
jgi:hypothetical protein